MDNSEETARMLAELSAGVEDTATSSRANRSPLLAAVLSFLLPGLGQLYGRHRRPALVFLVPFLIAVGWVALQLTNGVLWFGLSFLDSSFALTFAVGAVFVGLWWCASILHAFVSTGGRRRPRIPEAAVLAGLIVVVLTANGYVAWVSAEAYHLDTTIEAPAVAAASPSPSSAPVGSYSSGQTSPSGSFGATPTATPVPYHHLTIALIGIDWIPGRNGGQDDALMLVSLDLATHKVAMINMPRDMAYFDYYWGGRTGINTKINNFANLVDKKLIHAPDHPGYVALANELGYLVGIKVDYYAAVNMATFQSLVDAMGGVCVYNARAINDPSTGTFIGSGTVCLNGKNAVLFARSRHNGGSDYVRAGRQQAILLALAKKLASPRGLVYLPVMLRIASQGVMTNFPLKTARDYVSIVQNLKTGDVSNCVLGPAYSWHPPTTQSRGAWTLRLKMPLVAGLSVHLFGTDSRYYGMEGIVPAPCAGQS